LIHRLLGGQSPAIAVSVVVLSFRHSSLPVCNQISTGLFITPAISCVKIVITVNAGIMD
jgi:hypothetical protein